MMSRHFSATTPQHAPVPRAGLAVVGVRLEHGLNDGPVEKRGRYSNASPATITVVSVLFQSAKRFVRSQETRPAA